MVALTQTLEKPSPQEISVQVPERTAEALGGVATTTEVQLPEVIAAIAEQPPTESQQIINQALVDRFKAQTAAKQPAAEVAEPTTAPQRTPFRDLKHPKREMLNRR